MRKFFSDMRKDFLIMSNFYLVKILSEPNSLICSFWFFFFLSQNENQEFCSVLKWVSKLKTKLLLVEVKPNNDKRIRLEMVGMAQTRLKWLIYIVVPRVRAENQISWIKRALHYPFNWIRFLQINKLCNVIAKNLTF